MRTNVFFLESRLLMKNWLIFYALFVAATILQVALGYKCLGYSVLFLSKERHRTNWTHSDLEIAFACLCLIVFSILSLREIIRCHRLLREYGEFAKSLVKNQEVRNVLFQMKVTLFGAMIGGGFSILSGTLNHFNWIVLMLLLFLKIYYASKYKRLMNITLPHRDVFRKTA